MTRYFVHTKTGPVEAGHQNGREANIYAYADSAKTTADPREYTEVQVVPLDAVVIDGPLPEVGVGDDGALFARGNDDTVSAVRTSTPGGTAPNLTPEWHDARARQHTALAAYLRGHPPVDERQVDLVQDFVLAAIREGLWDDMTAREQAKYLVESGVRVGGGSDV